MISLFGRYQNEKSRQIRFIYEELFWGESNNQSEFKIASPHRIFSE
jgi:hypothetical protein